jgi:site-specific recombinase XerD
MINYINNDITVDHALLQKQNLTYPHLYTIYIDFKIYTMGIWEHKHCISTSINVEKNEWEQGKVKGRNNEAKIKNERLNQYLNKAAQLLKKISNSDIKTAKQVFNEIKINAKPYILGKTPKGKKGEYLSRLANHDYLTIMNAYLNEAKPCKERRSKYTVPYNLLKEFFDNDLPRIDQITMENLEDFKVWLIDSGRFKPNTITSYCCMITPVFNHALKLKLITEKPIPKGFAGTYLASEREIINEDDIMKVQAINDASLHAGELVGKYTMLFQFFTGTGIKEMKSIKLSDFKQEIINGKEIEFLEKKRTKTGIRYTVPLTTTTKKVKEKLIDLIGNEEKPFNLSSDSRINRIYQTLAEKAGIKKNVAPYQFRHGFAINHMDKGGSLEDLQKMLGHKNLETTSIYGKITKERLSLAMEVMESKSKIHKINYLKAV